MQNCGSKLSGTTGCRWHGIPWCQLFDSIQIELLSQNVCIWLITIIIKFTTVSIRKMKCPLSVWLNYGIRQAHFCIPFWELMKYINIGEISHAKKIHDVSFSEYLLVLIQRFMLKQSEMPENTEFCADDWCNHFWCPLLFSLYPYCEINVCFSIPHHHLSHSRNGRVNKLQHYEAYENPGLFVPCHTSSPPTHAEPTRRAYFRWVKRTATGLHTAIYRI